MHRIMGRYEQSGIEMHLNKDQEIMKWILKIYFKPHQKDNTEKPGTDYNQSNNQSGI